jgi:hypothetical protein
VIRCNEHPKYGAVRAPASKCPMCWAIYLTMNGQLFESYGVRVVFMRLAPQ